MGNVNEEITRIAEAKTSIEEAIEYCGVDVPDGNKINTYSDYIRAIPAAVFSQFNLDQVGGTDKYIKSIKQENGTISAEAGATTNTVEENSTALITSGGVYSKVSEYLPLIGGTLSGQLSFSGSSIPHIIGNDSQLCLGASSAGSQLVLEPQSVRRSSSDAGVTLGTSTYPWAAVYASKLYGKATGLAVSDNIVNSETQDTVDNWGPLGTSIHYYGSKILNGQPNPYGLVVNVTNNGKEVHQLWMAQPGGDIYHRGGNREGWRNTGTADQPIYWRALLDSSNYTNYITETKFPGLKNQGTVTSITAGTGLTGGTITKTGTIDLATSGVTPGSYGPTANVTGSNDTPMSVPNITVDSYGRITAASNKTYTAKNYYPTTFTWTAGSTSGPTGSLTVYGTNAVSFGAIPSAGASASGIVTTAAQTFAGDKTFNNHLIMSGTSRIKFNNESNYIHGSSSHLQINGASYTYFSLGGSDKLRLLASALHPMSSEGLTLGTSSYKFGDVYAKSIGTSGSRCTYGYFSNAVYATSGFYQSSDETLKTILKPVGVNLEDLAKLRKVYYLWKDDSDKRTQLGMIAQDVQKVYPELVDVDKETGVLSLAYDKLSVVALAAVDKLQEEIGSLQKKNIELEDRISKLENLLLYGKEY